MAFKNLEQRYTERSKALYAAATLKFDGGKPSRGANDDPLIVRKPGDGYWRDGEGRGLPARSAAQDVKRLTLFTVSVRGVAFLAKQQLLQTGNTFEATRIINPAFVVASGVPFSRVKRFLDIPITARGIGRALLGTGEISRRLFGSGKQKSDITSLRAIGQIQQETYNKFVDTSSPVSGLLKKIPVISKVVSAVGAKRSVGDGVYNWNNSRPELAKDMYVLTKFYSQFKYSGPIEILQNYGIGKPLQQNILDIGGFSRMLPALNGTTYTTYFRKTDGSSKTNHSNSSDYKNNTIVSETDSVKDLIRLETPKRTDELGEVAKNLSLRNAYDSTIQQKILDSIEARKNPNRKYLEYFSPSDGISITGQFEEVGGTLNARNRANDPDIARPISYIKDPLNLPSITPVKRLSVNTPSIYDNLPTTGSVKNDIINVSFAMSSDAPVQFRAFVSNINESSTPQYKEYQYIGRVERYISYVSVKRSVGFKLVVVAYSEDELQTVWKKINYLTALTYPYNVYKGILQPNIVKLTLGNIYTDQPGYVTSIRSDFGGNISSWDINQQVPHGATVDIQFDIIEKQGVTSAGSRLYGILQNEGTGQQQGPQNITPTIGLPQPTFV